MVTLFFSSLPLLFAFFSSIDAYYSCLLKKKRVSPLLCLLQQQCFEEALSPFDESMARDKKMSRDDWMHGSLLTINELLRCSNNEAEVGYSQGEITSPFCAQRSNVSTMHYPTALIFFFSQKMFGKDTFFFIKWT